MKPMKRNLNELSKQLSKSVKSHAKSALILGKESKKLTKASQSHSRQVNKLKRMSKRASYTNLTKLANKRDEDRKPGMVTYAPAALGALGAGGAGLSYSRSEAREWNRWRNFLEKIKRAPEKGVGEYYDEEDAATYKRWAKETLDENLDDFTKAKGTKNKYILGGAALLGTGIGATAFLRNRNKRKQER